MNCPRCGGELESGTLYTEKHPYWTRQKKLPVFRAPKDAVRLREPGDDSAGSFDAFPFHAFPETMLCRSCKLVVVQYN